MDGDGHFWHAERQPGGGRETVGCTMLQTWLRYSGGAQELSWPDLRSDMIESDTWFRLETFWPSLGASGVAQQFQTESHKNLATPPPPLITTTRPPAHPKTTKGDILAGEFGRGFRGRVNSRGFRPLFRGIWAGEFGREFGGNSGGIRPRFRGIRPRHCLRNPTARCAGASNELHRVVLV